MNVLIELTRELCQTTFNTATNNETISTTLAQAIVCYKSGQLDSRIVCP